MRNLHDPDVDRFRRRTDDVLQLFGTIGNHKGGVFDVPILSHPSGYLKVIASVGRGWDHVSASLPDRCPTWTEMCVVKNTFFHDYEVAMQFHPPKALYVNHHPYTLHLWRPLTYDFKLPDTILVGPMEEPVK